MRFIWAFIAVGVCFIHSHDWMILSDHDEENVIKKSLEDHGKDKKEIINDVPIVNEIVVQPKKKTCFSCDGIVYVSEHNWTAWINGEPMTSKGALSKSTTLSHINASSITLTKGSIEKIIQVGESTCF
jgi:hypothetical protein